VADPVFRNDIHQGVWRTEVPHGSRCKALVGSLEKEVLLKLAIFYKL